jgi:hypothetical protein
MNYHPKKEAKPETDMHTNSSFPLRSNSAYSKQKAHKQEAKPETDMHTTRHP